MKKKHILCLAPFVATLLAPLQASLAFADEVLRPGNDINCSNLTSPDESVNQLMARYASQARIEELKDPLGEPFSGVALYPDDPHLRIEIEPEDRDIKKKVIGLNLTQRDSHWTIFGLTIGMTLEDVTTANGEPLKLTGFWEHTDGIHSVFGELKPGQLDGGCRVIVFLASSVPLQVGDPLYGLDDVMSNDPDLIKHRPTVSGLFIVWNKPGEE